MQIEIALIVTHEGLPLAHEVLPGNTDDSTISLINTYDSGAESPGETGLVIITLQYDHNM